MRCKACKYATNSWHVSENADLVDRKTKQTESKYSPHEIGLDFCNNELATVPPTFAMFSQKLQKHVDTKEHEKLRKHMEKHAKDVRNQFPC